MLEMARVNFNYFRGILVFFRSRFPLRGSDESMSHSDMVRGLVPSMVRCEGWAILSWWKDWFLPCQMWVLSQTDVTIGLVPTWSDISDEFHSWNGGTWSVTRKDQYRSEGHSDMTVGLVPTWSDVSASPSNMHAGLVPHMGRYKCRAFLTCMLDWFLAWSNVSAEPFRHVGRIGSSHGRM